MPTTIEQLVIVQARLARYYTAETAILKGQSYSIGNRSLTRADLKTVQDTIKELETKEKTLDGGNAIRIQRAVPRDI